MELTPTLQDLLPGSPTHLRWPWLALLLAALLLGVVLWWLLRWTSGPAVPVSRSDRVRALPRFRLLLRRRRWLAALQTVAALTLVAGCLLVVARPSGVVTYVQRPSRDVVVCLDVSPSMLKVDAAVVRSVQEVVASLPGDRFGLTLFDGRNVVKFPLTDDRAFVDDALAEAERAFADRDRSYYRATSDPYRASIISDGLQACANGFDRLAEQRGRVVLAVSDARPFGGGAYDLTQAAEQAVARDVVIHGLAPPKTKPGREEQFRTTVEATGGELAMLEDDNAVDQVVSRIDEVEQRRLAEPPQVAFSDRPESGVLLAGSGALLLVLTWVRRRP